MKLKRILLSLLILSTLLTGSCATKTISTESDLNAEDREFLKPNPDTEEVFRVFLSSDHYVISQMKNIGTIQRVVDSEGDRYMCSEIKALDMIEEKHEGVVSILLFPDSGKVMKVRPKKSTSIMEIDKIITEDMQRWSFSFPSKVVDPTKLDIRYRVRLRKKMTDDEIMQRYRDNMRQSQ
jgi:hypothetical protein